MTKVNQGHFKSLVSIEKRKDFYKSPEWARIRYMTLSEYGNSCMACGAKPPDVTIHVDHIKPISTHWSLRDNLLNLQVLCAQCNAGKSNVDYTDWRSKPKVVVTRDKIPAVNQERFVEYVKKIDNSPFTKDFSGMLLTKEIVNVRAPYEVLRMIGLTIPLVSGWRDQVLGRRVKPSVAFEIYKYLNER